MRQTPRSHSETMGLTGRDLGPLGYADADGSIVYYHRTTRPHTLDTEFDVRELESLPRVDVVVSYVGADGAMIDAAVKAGAKGIVSGGTGAGRPTPLEDEAFMRVVWKKALAQAVNETNIDVFPGACPWSVEQVLDERFLPE